jgi:hypothetical protein
MEVEDYPQSTLFLKKVITFMRALMEATGGSQAIVSMG